jgi:isopentenyl diphosphate isomerase/L-lactate dehydrogenase-like FMN-dependent dehydrogenase
MPVDFVTNQEIILAARRNLTQNVWDYLTGGAESETTMRRNRFGLDSLAFRPRSSSMSRRSTHRRPSLGTGLEPQSC